MKRSLMLVLVVLALLVAACGGGDEGESSDGTEAETTQDTEAAAEEEPAAGEDPVEETEDALDTAEAANDEANTEAGGGMATVTLDGTTYETMSFADAIVQRCDPDFFGGFWVLLTSDPDPANQPTSIEMTFPGGDFTDPPKVVLKVPTEDLEWIADENEEFGADDPRPAPSLDWTIDGNTVTGSGTFWEENSYFAYLGGQVDEVMTAEGTFEATCP